MKRVLLSMATLAMAALPCHAAVYYVTVAGLGGEPDYEQRFTANAKDLDRVFKAAPGAHVTTLMGPDATKAKLIDTLSTAARDAKPEDDLVLVLIGHGSFDGDEYKFNLPGPDISGTELADALKKVNTQRQLVVNTTSCSGGSLPALQKTGRAVVTSTKAGTEKNATVFARYWIEALQDPGADTDKSGSISAMEAFTYADRKTGDFYTTQKRIATEHALFEDAGQGEGVRTLSAASREGALMTTFAVLRIGADSAAANNPAKLALLERKEALEREVDTLKYQKAAMDPGEYRRRLTAALLELAKVQEAMDK